VSKVISFFSVTSVGKLSRVFLFPGSLVGSDSGPDRAFQLLTLPAGLVSLLAVVPLRFQRLLLPWAPLCLSSGPLWDMACLLLHRLLTRHVHVFTETCFSVCFGDDRNDENSRRSNLW